MKSSTSTEAIRKHCQAGDHEWLLNELLAVIHRDHGQYTKLAGLQASFEDALVSLETQSIELTGLRRKSRLSKGSP